LDTNTIFLLVLFSPGSAETAVGCDGKLNNHLMVSCIKNIFIKKLLKSDNLSLGYNQKCPGCFFPDTVYLHYLGTTHYTQNIYVDKISATASTRST